MSASAFVGFSGTAQSLGLSTAEGEAGLSHKTAVLKRLDRGCDEMTLKDRNTQKQGPSHQSSEHLGPVGNLGEEKKF